MSSRLSVSGLSKRFGVAALALDGVAIEVAEGEVHAVIGENGAGKSTLMNILSGAMAPDAGTILLDGAPFAPRLPIEARRAGVTMVHQELALCSHLTVAENVTLGAEPGRGPLYDRDAAIRRTRDTLNELLGEADRIDPQARADSLSIADRQLVEIARAVAGPNVPRVAIFDEPTSSLGRADRERLFRLIRGLAKRGVSVLYVSHFLEEVRAVCDRFTILRDGKTVTHGEVASTSNEEMLRSMAGRQVDTLFPRSARTPGEVALRVDNLAGLDKPQRASFELRYGEVLGIAGLVGAGRTELLRTIFGLDPLREGTIRIGARDGSASPRSRVEGGVGMVAEDRKHEGLATSLSIADNVTMSDRGFWARPSLLHREAARWIERLGIRAREPSQTVAELSGGNQQKVLFARLLQCGTNVILLDEPTRGVDVQSKMQIYRLIDDLAKEGKAILVVSSYLPELLGICDRIAVMFRGVLGAAEPAEACTEESLLARAAGVSA